MHVSAILKNKGSTLITAKPEDSVASVVTLLSANRIGAVLAMDGKGTIAGIISERDVVRGLAEKGPDVLQRPVSELMTEKVISCAPTDTVASVMEKMTQGRFRHLPVCDGEKLVGFISIGDVVKHRLEEAKHEVESLRDYVSGGF